MTSFPITSYHLLTGNWLAIIVAFHPIYPLLHKAFYVTRAKDNMKYEVTQEHRVDQ